MLLLFTKSVKSERYFFWSKRGVRYFAEKAKAKANVGATSEAKAKAKSQAKSEAKVGAKAEGKAEAEVEPPKSSRGSCK